MLTILFFVIKIVQIHSSLKLIWFFSSRPVHVFMKSFFTRHTCAYLQFIGVQGSRWLRRRGIQCIIIRTCRQSRSLTVSILKNKLPYVPLLPHHFKNYLSMHRRGAIWLLVSPRKYARRWAVSYICASVHAKWFVLQRCHDRNIMVMIIIYF